MDDCEVKILRDMTGYDAQRMAANWFVHGDVPKLAQEAAQAACARFGGCSEVILDAYAECILVTARKACGLAGASQVVHVDGDLTREELVNLQAHGYFRMLLAGEDDLARLI